MKVRRGTSKIWFMLMFLCTFVILAVCMSGCKEKEDTKENTKEDRTMGRYLEEKLELPAETRRLYDVAVTEEGELWLAAITDEWYIFTSRDGGKSWEKSYSIMEKIDPGRKNNQMNIQGIFIGKNKELAVYVIDYTDYEETGETDQQLWYIDSSGKAKGFDSPEGYFGSKIAFDTQGNMVIPGTEKCFQMSTENGEIIKTFEQYDQYGMQVCGDTLIVFYSNSQMTYYDLKTGKPLEADTVLSGQVSKNLFWTGESPVVFTEDEPGKMFFCNRDGIYSHVYGGSVMEQVVDASLCSLGITSRGYLGFAKSKEGDFYVVKTMEENGQDETFLYRYYYNPDIPTIPEEELKVYTLDECPELAQAALFYQMKHPEVHVVVETGIEAADNSVSSDGYMDSRRVDTVKNLNTEILAGKGPDILVLDNLPVDAYIEKGILKDISETLKQEDTIDKILPNIVEACRQEDGKLYSIPARVRIPVLMGEKNLLEKGTGAAGVRDMAKEAKDELADTQSIYPYFMEGDLAEVFIKACSYDWQKQDGTLDKASLREYLEQTGEIYHSEKKDKMTNNGSAGGNTTFEEGIGLGLFQVYIGTAKLTFGELCSPGQSELVESIVKGEPELAWKSLNEGSYCPWMTLGINTKSSNQKRAEEFLLYLMGEEGQRIQQGYGFSVNKDVLDTKNYWGIDEGVPADRPKNFMGLQLPSGGTKDLYIFSLTDEQTDNMRGVLSGLDKPYRLDVEVKTLIKDETRKYFQEKETLDEAVANLIDKINLYLSE